MPAAKKKAPAKKTPAKKSNTRSKSKATQNQTSKAPAWIASFFVASVLLAVFLFVDSAGMINGVVKAALLGLFGKPACLIPFILAGLAAYLIKSKDMHAFYLKTAMCFLALVNISALFHLSTPVTIPITEAYESAAGSAMGSISQSVGGGFFGGCVGIFLEILFRKIASFIILILTFLALVSVITKISIFGMIAGFIRGIIEDVRQVKDSEYYEKGYHVQKKAAKRVKRKMAPIYGDAPVPWGEEPQDQFAQDVLEEAWSFTEDEMLQEREQTRKNMEREKELSRKQAMEEEKKVKKESRARQKPSEEAVAMPAAEEADNGLAELFADVIAEEAPGSDYDRTEDSVVMPSKDEIESAGEKASKKAASLTPVEQERMHHEIESSLDKPVQEYIYPPVDLLNRIPEKSGDNRKEMYETANKLISILNEFGVTAKLLQVTQGPSVTRYEIQPNTGTKLKKIVGLADDLALNMAVSNVLVAPVPGKAAVGIEVPNREVGSVAVRELIESEEFKKSKSKLSVALGKDIGGRVVVGDIAKMPHVLIAGATGSGKSVCINTIITSILYKAKPEEVKLIMVDPKVVELGVYNGIPHLLIPVVTEPKKAAGALNWAVAEMMHRYDSFAENSVRNLEGYNKLMEKTGGEKLPQIVIIIDELADLMMVAAKEVEDYVCRLAQLARAAGIHLIIATQRPSVDVITGLIKANIPSRIAFAVSSQVDSRTILDKGGAEKLLGRGDMLYHPTNLPNPVRVQGAFVSDSEIEKIVGFLKDEKEETHYSEDLEEHIERCAIGENGVTPDEDEDGDELLPKAIELAAELGQISTAMIQRRLKVGYSRAGRIIDQMEERGVISGPNGSKPRQVYVNRSELTNYTD